MKNGKLVVVELIAELISRGGAETFFYSLVEEMSKKNDIELHVVVLYKNIHNSFECLFQNRNIHMHVIGKHKGPDFGCAKRLKRIIREIQPDVINGHLNYLLTYCLAFGRRTQQFKLVHTTHSFSENEQLKFKKHLNKKHLINFIGISDLVTNQIKKELSNTTFVKTIYNGIPLEPVNMNSNRTNDFIIVASLSPVKNHKLLLKAFDKYMKTYGLSSLLIVVGGPLLEETKQYAIELGCDKNVEFTGTQSNVYPFLLKSKSFVLCSHREGNPISILEAMNAGLPIVAFSVGGIPDIVKDGKNGFLAEPDNIDSLVDAMRKSISLNDKNIIGKYNHEYIKQYSINNTMLKYINLFYELTQKGS